MADHPNDSGDGRETRIKRREKRARETGGETGEKSGEAVSRKFPGRNGPRKEYCLFRGSCKVLTKVAHVESGEPFPGGGRTVFPRLQIPPGLFPGILQRPRDARGDPRRGNFRAVIKNAFSRVVRRLRQIFHLLGKPTGIRRANTYNRETSRERINASPSRVFVVFLVLL